MKIIITLSFFLLANFGISQKNINYIKYKNRCEKAYDLAIRDSSYNECIAYLNKLSKKYPILGEEFLLRAYCYKMLGNNDDCALSIKTAYSSLFLDINITFPAGIKMLDPSGLIQDFTAEQMAVVEEGYKLFSLRITSLSDSLLYLFEDMNNKDQEVRNLFLEAEKQFEDTSIIVKSVENEMLKVDLENQRILKDLIAKYGYPGFWLCPQGQGYLNLVFFHSAYEEFYKEMRPILKKELKKGHIGASDYANWEERYYLEFNKTKYSLPGRKKGMKLLRERKVLKNRRKIGLSKYYPWELQENLIK